MKRIMLTTMVLLFGLMWMALPAATQPPGGDGDKGGAKGGKGGASKGGSFKLGSALPPQLVEELNLTDEQKSKLETIEKDLKAKLEKLLTPEQKKTIENFRMGPGGAGGKGGGGKGGKGGDGGPGGGKGDKGDKGDKGGDKNGNIPERPPQE